ncbi:hypothetical protein CW740_07570 [Kangiella profundi]|uniref:Uncharacterized protein n=1 Tax=Kangiella profundi TaxID=1561924 RepID=A0A2K9ANB6_9GAMM|nr:hypothetical protein [Kangiella profundi]AUD79112.1 hypothetical protein CW740_07570 [Kangiella profundi]GGF01360.1 hypothetical protein GCM10011356_13840 [Kangiella profundi]
MPPILGAILFFIYADFTDDGTITLIDSGDDPFLPIRALLEIIGFAYMFVGIQALIATTIMEFLALTKVKSIVLQMVIAGLLGLISGGVLGEWLFLGIGLIVGFCAGYGLIWFKQKENSIYQK